MIKVLNRKNRIEKELGKSVKIFGKTITVNIIYSKSKNPELDLVGNIVNVYRKSWTNIDTFYIDIKQKRKSKH